jgi:hypothetical protein
MWVETIFSREDLTGLLEELMPAKMRLGDPKDDAWLALFDLGEVVLVPQTGLRVTCKAKLRWDVAGIAIPVTLHSLTVLLRPLILKRATGDVLSFALEIEHADLANVPEFIDLKITERVNRELAKQDLAWDFTTALSRFVPLPPRVEPIDAIDLKVAWGKLRIDENALVIAVSFHAHLLREGESRPPIAPIIRSAPPPPLARSLRPGPGAVVIATGIAFFWGAVVASMWTRSRATVW